MLRELSGTAELVAQLKDSSMPCLRFSLQPIEVIPSGRYACSPTRRPTPIPSRLQPVLAHRHRVMPAKENASA